MTKIYTETPAFGAEGYLIYQPFEKAFVFRKYNGDSTFVDYRLTHPDLCIKITDVDAAFYEIDGRHYLDLSTRALERSESE